jgi:hypothetical protein
MKELPQIIQRAAKSNQFNNLLATNNISAKMHVLAGK